MGADQIREFLLHLVEVRKLSRSSIKHARAALKFLYSVTLNRPVEVRWIPMPCKQKRLPNLLSGSEVNLLLKATRLVKFRAIFATMYSAGAQDFRGVSTSSGAHRFKTDGHPSYRQRR
jgi:site-specific recombinase XerD